LNQRQVELSYSCLEHLLYVGSIVGSSLIRLLNRRQV